MTLTAIVKSHRFHEVSSRLCQAGLVSCRWLVDACLHWSWYVLFVLNIPPRAGRMAHGGLNLQRQMSHMPYILFHFNWTSDDHTPPPCTQWNELRSCSISTIHHTRDHLYPPCRKWAKKSYEDFLKVGGSLSKRPRVNTLNQNFKMSPLELKCSTEFSSTICHCLRTTILCFNKCLTMELCMSCMCCGIWRLHFQYQAFSCP